MKRRLLLNVVIREGAAILQLLASKDQPLLIGRDPFLVLNLGLNVLDAIGRFHFQGDGFASQSFDEDLHASTKTEDEMKRRLLLNVVIREGAAILQLLASKDQPLLIGRDPFLVLNLGLNVLDAIGRFHFQGDGFASQGFDEDLHASTQTEDEMKRRLLLNVVI